MTLDWSQRKRLCLSTKAKICSKMQYWKVIKNTSNIIPVKNDLSETISQNLKKLGMKYVGAVIIYSYLQAIGIVNDHELICFKH